MKKLLFKHCKRQNLQYQPGMNGRLIAYLIYVYSWSYIKRSVERFDRFLEYSKVFKTIDRIGEPFNNA